MIKMLLKALFCWEVEYFSGDIGKIDNEEGVEQVSCLLVNLSN